MSLMRLRAVLPPPSRTVETPCGAGWDDVHARLGLALPEDYRSFIELYGSGRIDRFLGFYNPFSRNPYVDLVAVAGDGLQPLREAEFQLPYAYYPELGGLLPCGRTDNGDEIYWRTVGEPSRWTIVVNETRSLECEEHLMTMTSFLAGVLDGTVRSEILSEFLAATPHCFEPNVVEPS